MEYMLKHAINFGRQVYSFIPQNYAKHYAKSNAKGLYVVKYVYRTRPGDWGYIYAYINGLVLIQNNIFIGILLLFLRCFILLS